MSLTQEQMVAWCTQLIEDAPDFPALEACLQSIAALDALADLPAGSRVLVRGDTDVVFDDKGEPDDDSRLRSLVETLGFGIQRGWVQILYGHRGRDPQLSLQPVAGYLAGLLKAAGHQVGPIQVIGDWMNNDTGEILDSAAGEIARLPHGSVVLLENTRKYKLEQSLWKAKKAELPALCEKLTRYANGMREKIAAVHVNEGLAASNRDLSSTVVPVAMQRNALGKYIDAELRTHLQQTRKAEMIIFSGMKLEKLDDLRKIIDRGQTKVVICAGLLAIALKRADAELAGQTFEMGISGDPNHKLFIGPDWIEKCKSMLQKGRGLGVEFVLPVDFTLGDGSASPVIPAGGAQFDVGPQTIALHAAKCGEFIEYSRKKIAAGQGPAVAFHNGVFGKFEEEKFAEGTRQFMLQLQRMTAGGVQTYVGGGEGSTALHRYGDDSWVTHCFTAGGTILKALGTEPIPYIKALYLAAKR